MSEQEANDVMLDIETFEEMGDWDAMLQHLYEMHKMRDEVLYQELTQRFEHWIGDECMDFEPGYFELMGMQTWETK